MSHREYTGGGSVKKKITAKLGSIKVTKVIKGPRTGIKHTPSSYLADMQRSTEERLALTTEMYPPKIIELLDIGSSLQKDTSLDVDQALFQPFPSEVIFQQFEPHKTYEFPLQLRNNDKVARAIKVTHQDSPYFSVSCPKSTGGKVAPGMETTCLVVFTPDERKDYQHELVCVTEREKFVVPVRAVGARALLDFPDEINFSAAPVKCSSTKTVLVRNVGNTEAKFSLQTQEPFSASPSTATLAVGACMQVNVEFVPKKVGDHTSELVISYNTGEEVYTQLYGSANNVNVRLDRSSLTLESTYIGLSSQRSAVLHNRSEVVVHFQWKAFASEAEEEMQREIRSQQLAEEESLSKETFFERCMHNPSIRDRLPILTRSLDMNRKKYLDEERFLYADEAICIDPIEGDIWPNSQAEISINFQPEEATAYSRVAYCDVAGRESRLPLRIKGEGLGPRLQFSFDTLDIQNVFVNSAHAYEIVLENRGDVDGVYSLVPPNSLFGPKFTFAPSSGVIQPERLQAIQISFCSTELGEFSEEFQWQVEGATHPLKLQIRGVVIGPTFQFDVPQIKFGTVSYGFLTTCEVTLSNTSEIPMTYHLRVPGESTPPPASTAHKAAQTQSRAGSKEFDTRPHAGTLPPNFHQTIKVSFTPASVKSYSTALIVDVDEAGKEVFSLPITAESIVPAITLLTPVLDYGRCFLQHPYVHNVELQNESKLPVKYKMPAQVNRSLLVYSTAHPKGVIEPNSILSIPLQVKAQLQGELSTSAVFNILGSSDSPVEVGIYCIGEGPVISVNPNLLAWGTCPVLIPLTKRVTLVNESLIPAEFECALAREKTIFTVDPVSAVIPPDEKIELTVTALIDDCLKFTDKLTILVSQGVCFTVELSAEGQGTTIVSHPPMQPSINLGPHFSREPCQKQFTLTNRGRRLQALSWTTDGFSAAKLKRLEIERSSRDTKDIALKHRSKPHVPEAKKPLFQIIPDKFVLEPYQSIVVTLEGYSQTPQPVNERLICHAIIGKNPHKERIMTVDVSARFIAPLLEFNTQELFFKIYQPPGSKLVQHCQDLVVRNVSPLSVTTVLLCGYPFSILAANTTPVAQMELSLKPSEDSTVRILYDSTYCVDKHTHIEDSFLAVAYKEHPQRDRIALKSEVHFPNMEFETMEVNFGCILNDTETIHIVKMTNCSPLEVKYAWSFLRRPPVRRVDPALLDEGVDMESECESDSLEDSDEADESDTSHEGSISEDNQTDGASDAVSKSPHSGSSKSENGGTPSEQNSQSDSAAAEQLIKDQLEQVELRRTSLTPVQEEDSKIHIIEDEDVPQAVIESGLPEDDTAPSLSEGTEEQEGNDSRTDSKKKVKRVKQPWELTIDPFTPISIEQIFDILPLHGTVQPGHSQQVQFTFYGHAGVATEVIAACKVEGGPTYQLRLSGEASEVQYRFSTKQIDFGCQLYDQVHTAEIVLYNSGKVDLDFCSMGVGESTELRPGEIAVSPATGKILALENRKLTVRYFPGVPAKFNKTFQIQVAHFEPDVITVSGDGIFPRIAFNLPQYVASIPPAIVEEADANTGARKSQEDTFEQSSNKLSLQVPSRELLSEIERLMVKDFAVQHYSKKVLSTPQRKLGTAKLRPALPEYHLDFGFVVYGLVVSRSLTLTNVGHCPVSFTTANHVLEGSGFSIDLGGKIRSLPEMENLEFAVRFDPAAIKSPEGRVEATLPFNLVGGPAYRLKLSAEVTRPNMKVSSCRLDFGTVVCGQCKIVTIRLSNPYSVKCDWNAITDKPAKKIPKHVPLHVRKKMKHKPLPKFFEVEPSSGILLPGQYVDVRVKFMPSEELHYVEKIPLAIRQNTEHDLILHLEGMGSEPHIEFDQNLVEFTPVLPFAPGSDAEVNVSNPMPYPVEIYSLEFDKQYLNEEEVLQWVKSYDKLNRLFLPPTSPGGTLPEEVMQAYDKDQKMKAELTSETNIIGESGVSMEAHGSQPKLQSSQHQLAAYEHKTPQPSSTALPSHPELSIVGSISGLTQATGGNLSSHGDLELSPVAMAIARHLGIDLTPEAAEAESRRGLAVIIHGPQSSGRTTQAKILGERYSSAVIAIDEVLIEAISSASTPAGCKAREYCIQTEEVKAAEAAEAAALAAASKKQITKESSKDKEVPSELQASPIPRKLFEVQPLLETQYAIPNGRMMPTVLSEELIVEILSDRLQHLDCRKGIIVDGIDSDFTPGNHITTALILRALNNRKSIYFVLLEMELQAIQEREDKIEKERIRKIQEIESQKLEAEKREQQRVEALLNMDEDEYESLSVEQQREIDQKRLERKKERRLQRQREKEEQERIEQERRQEEERKLDEEKLKKKGKKDTKQHTNAIKPPQVAALAQKPTQTSRPDSNAQTQPPQMLGGVGPTVSVASVLSGVETPGGTQKRKSRKLSAKPSGMSEEHEALEETLLERAYGHYKQSLGGMKTLLENWDRQKGMIRPKPQPELEENKTVTPSRTKGKGKQKESSNEQEQKAQRDDMEDSREGLGVPIIAVQAVHKIAEVTEQICTSGLPSVENILEGMGLGPSGPPLPKPVTLQVHPFPLKRRKLEQSAHERFIFIAASPDDLNAPKEENPKAISETQEEVEEPVEKQPPSRLGKRAGSVRSMDSSDSGHRKPSSHKVPSRKRGSIKTTSPVAQLLSNQEEVHVHVPATGSEVEISKPTGPVKLVKFRWVIPAKGQTKIKLHFSSQDRGQFDHTLNFEIVGTRRHYQLFCRGLCVVPSICSEPRIVFANRKKTLKNDEIVHKRYVLSRECYYFGPLHCGKTRDRYKEGRYPENMETVTISNTSLMSVDVSFYFQHDHNAQTFLLEPPNMALEPGESKDLTLWAYPKSSAHVKDALVCCVKHNPDPVIFNICCDGVEPELKVDRKTLEFKKVLLHRKQTNVLHLHNHTLLPVAWKLSGLEQLGDEFTFSQDHGIVQPRSNFPLHVHFRASKQVNYTKKAFKIEISDVEQIMGLMHVEPVQIMAEAYDVALDVSFPRGTDGGLDFQCIKVGDEQKLVVQLKNKGKYDIGFKFIFELVADKTDYSKMFTLSPSHSTLYPGEKAQPVSVIFKTNKEVCIKDLPVLKCQVIDAHVGEQGEVIANIPIVINAKAVFSKFVMSPINDINFGCMMVNTRKSCTFTLENRGEFEFKYAIIKKLSAEQKKQRAVNMAAAAAKARTKSREGREGGITSARSSLMAKPGGATTKNKEASLRTEVLGGSQRLILGMFTVSPAMGPIQAGQSQTITVDCIADKPGSHEEILSVEISDRHKDDPPVTYKICGEVLIPGINTADMASIFEEHRVCHQLGVLGQHKFHEDGCVGVYGEDERRFVFKSVIVRQTSQARFKISNPNKISCDVQLSVKSMAAKQKGPPETVFEVLPSNKVSIPAHSHIYATVTFKPTAMQTYSATFEVATDGVKGKGLTFDLQGEGNLPQIAVLRPTIRNAKGNLLLLFKRLLLHQSQSLPLILRNTGTIPATAVIETLSGSQAFKLIQLDEDFQTDVETETELSSKTSHAIKPSSKGSPPVSVQLPVNTIKELAVVFQPNVVKKSRGELCVRIKHNQFEQLPIQLVGEGYEDEVCIENIRGQVADEADDLISDTSSDEIEASSENHLYFGCMAVGQSRQLTFTLSNHSTSSPVRFEWPSSQPSLSFSPAVGHLKPGCSKDVAVSFKSDKPLTIKTQKVFGKISKISYSKPFSEIPDWDDRMKSVSWINVHTSASRHAAESDSDVPRQSAVAPAKRKVVKTEPEPIHSVLEEREMEMFATALTDFAKYDCPITEVDFKDTNMYMSRVYSFPLINTGTIPLLCQWSAVGSNGSPLPVHSSQLNLDDADSIISEGGELMPFSITPLSSQIDPGKEQTFNIRFAPLDVLNLECKFQCNIPNLDGSCEPLEVIVRGNSLMPYCHFDLESSDYLSQRSGERREAGFGTGVAAFDAASTRVIEFSSCGIGTKIVKCFHIINPTSSGYDFMWSDEGGAFTEPFKCATPQGYVAAGKKYEIVFEYQPKSLALVESLWKFSIPSLSLSQTFLLVGHTVEPAVNLDRAYVNFKSMLLGSKSKEVVYLLNNEPTAYQFAFSERSCLSDGHARLIIDPMSGTIQPNAKLPIEIAFKAVQEKEYNFNLKCSVKKKPTPLVLNVKADGYGINAALSYTNPDGEEESLSTSKIEKRIINFGQVAVNERAFGQISVFNNGQYSFEYRWVLSDPCKKQGGSEQPTLITITPEEGVVEPNDRTRCELSFSPPSKTNLKGCELLLEIVNGPSLPIVLKGSGVEPQVDFSFTEFDFGPCFLQRSDMPAKDKTLTITNNDKKAVSVNSLFTNKQHLSVEFEASLLQPGQDCIALVEFKPRDTVKYDEDIVFELNGLSRKAIKISGEGAKMKLELANPANKIINFGALMIGKQEEEGVIKTSKLVNQSPIAVSFTLSLLPSSSVPALQEEGVFSLKPEGEVTLKANGGSCNISIAFRPKQRVPQFSEEVTLECSGVSQPLLVVTGSCHGLEITLDSTHVPFGAVVQHSQSSRRILMINSGDIGARFNWEKEKFAPDFTISPTEGYISPGMEVPFDITFHPSQLNHDIRYDGLKCHIEGSKKPKLLTLSGLCIEKVPFKEMLCFTTNVRSKETRHLTIHNKTSSHWLIRPVIDGEFWNGPDTLSIEPNQARHYELTYHPLTMSTESQKHHGSIFFPLPDGTGLLYHLQGSAEPPKHAGAVSQEVPCKTSHTELLSVENWLRRPQRFKVTIDMIRPEKLDRSVSLHGLDYIDVPALGRRDHKLKFYSFKECSLLAKVTFLNEQTREYLFYHVNIKSTPPGIMKTIELTTPVRKSTSHVITITNPLPAPVTVHTNTNIGDISLPANFIVGAQSEGKCMFEYLPLKVGETTGKLTLNSSELGLYHYELHLVATRPPPESPVHLTTHLGSSQQQQCRFISYAKGRTEYICKIDSSDFHVERTINVASAGSSGTEATVDVTFEPSHLGDTHATLTISSSAGGDYTIPLHGHCLTPKPQGPFTIKPGSSASIQFKNIFTQTTQFSFAVNNPAFVVKASDNLKSRKTYNILVTYDAKQADPSVVKTGKLVVTSQHSARAGSKHGGISWVYYLKGVSPS